MQIVAQATLTCPVCQAESVVDVPVDACVHFYICPTCKTKLSPKAGDCCVICSYGDTLCPTSPKRAVT